jgi:pimeloyl-ACP methyl ester carboxylesterase
MMRQSLARVWLAAVLSVVFVAGEARAAQPQVLTGALDGADYKIEVPTPWNGTLLLFSHGHIALGAPNPAQDAAGPPQSGPGTAEALLADGYALAGSAYSTTGWAVEDALTDQLTLLDYFTRTVGVPKRTIAWGQSMGGDITGALIEKYPDRFAGAVAMCGNMAGAIATWNQLLDGAFAFKVLLAPDSELQLVGISDPEADNRLAQQLIDVAQATPEGRARIALVAAMYHIPGWNDPASDEPAKDDFATREEQQYRWLKNLDLNFMLIGRAEVEARAGGNPSWNTGVDYLHRIDNSPERDTVYALYDAAGLSLNADLQSVEDAPRIAPNPDAVAYLDQYASLTGDVRVPVLTLHTTGDGLVPVSHEQAYDSSVRSAGRQDLLREIFVDRAGHCQFTPAERVAAIRALVHRIDSGRWEDLDALALNQVATALGPEANALTGLTPPVAAPSRFTAFTPPAFPRPVVMP